MKPAPESLLKIPVLPKICYTSFRKYYSIRKCHREFLNLPNLFCNSDAISSALSSSFGRPSAYLFFLLFFSSFFPKFCHIFLYAIFSFHLLLFSHQQIFGKKRKLLKKLSVFYTIPDFYLNFCRIVSKYLL